MSVESGDLREGRIVWATVRDHNGFRKQRPAIVLTPTEEISDDEPIVLMAITTTFRDPPPADHVELPWNADRRRTSTGLARRSAAVISWLDTVYLDEIDSVIGSVPPKVMATIRQHLKDLSKE